MLTLGKWMYLGKHIALDQLLLTLGEGWLTGSNPILATGFGSLEKRNNLSITPRHTESTSPQKKEDLALPKEDRQDREGKIKFNIL